MTYLIIGAWTLYVVIIIVLFRNFRRGFTLKKVGGNNVRYFPEKQKKLVIFLMLGAYMLLFLDTFFYEFRLENNFFSGVKSGLLSCLLATFIPRNFILIGVFLLMLYIDRKAKLSQSTEKEKSGEDETAP